MFCIRRPTVSEETIHVLWDQAYPEGKFMFHLTTVDNLLMHNDQSRKTKNVYWQYINLYLFKTAKYRIFDQIYV